MVTTLRQALAVVGVERRRRWLLLVGLALFTSVVEALGSLLVLALIRMATATSSRLDVPLLGDLSRRFPHQSRGSLVLAIGLTLGLFFLCRGILLCWQVYAQNALAQRTGVAISRQLIKGYLAMPYVWHLQRNSSELIRTSYDSVDRVAAYVLLPAVVMFSEGLVVIALLLVLLSTAPLATLLAVAVLGPVLLALARFVRPRLGLLGEETQSLVQQTLKDLQQAFEGSREITLLGKQAVFEGRLAATRDRLATVTYRRAALVEVPRYSIETAGMLFILLFLTIGLNRATPGGQPLAVLGLFAYAVLRLMPSVNRGLAYSNLLKFGGAALEQVHRDLTLIGSQPARGEASQPRPLRSTLALVDVGFRYPSGDGDVVSELNLTINAGESVGIVGPTGGGKSTLVDIVLGLLPPTRGRILLDGQDLGDDLAGWQATIASVPQMIFLLDDTLRANIAFGVPDGLVDEDALSEAVQLSQLSTVVADLPRGVDTDVGERGIRLSGGQRQRVAIARALYRRASVLVFDEGTSALDTLTEAELVADIERLKGSRTVITVAHRLSTVRQCDRIVVLDGGRVQAVGTFEELEIASELFRRLAV
ncbi:MAG: ABC transporter ATP-binding protein/permease [Actinomycetota bacterium]|nr:ABC transporter ATP-binding protein/permease [Actinomycetota bacterium]